MKGLAMEECRFYDEVDAILGTQAWSRPPTAWIVPKKKKGVRTVIWKRKMKKLHRV